MWLHVSLATLIYFPLFFLLQFYFCFNVFTASVKYDKGKIRVFSSLTYLVSWMSLLSALAFLFLRNFLLWLILFLIFIYLWYWICTMLSMLTWNCFLKNNLFIFVLTISFLSIHDEKFVATVLGLPRGKLCIRIF